jgi:hypothetical protein
VTTASVPANRDRWVSAIGYGLLAEIATIITIVIIVSVYRYGVVRGLSPEAYAAFGEKVGSVIGLVGGTLFTYLFARLLMRRLPANFIAHGIVVAVTAIALSVGGSIAGHGSVPAAYIVASLLKFAAGALAGWQAQRRVLVSP